MTAVARDLYIEQGATFILPFQWCSAEVVDDEVTAGDPRDLTGYTVRMQIRKRQQDDAMIDANTDNEQIIVGRDPEDPDNLDAANGWITVWLSDEDTDVLIHKTCLYDLEAEDPTGIVYRLLQGKVTVSPNITQEAEDPVVGS